MKITTRLILSFLMVTILPLAVMSYVGLRVMDRISIVALGESTESLKRLGEESIHQQALNVARQVELYLDTHPELLTASAKDLEANKALAALAVQPVGKTGYTALYDSDAVTHFHTNPALRGADLHTLASTLPEFWGIMEASLSGTPADGYYKWKEADGSIRDKYMSCTPVGKTHFRVAATTYIDEFYQPIQNTRATITGISRDTQRFFFVAMATSVGIAVLIAALLAAIIVRPLRRVTEGARLFSRGKLDQDIAIGTRDEIGQLAMTLNQMAQQLGKTLQEKDYAARQLDDLNLNLTQQSAERQQLADRQTTLYEVLQAVSGQLDPDAVAQQAAEAIARFTKWPHVCLAMPDAEETHWIIRGAGGRPAETLGTKRPLGQGVIGRAFRTGQTQLVGDITAEPDDARVVAADSNSAPADTFFRSEVAAPVRRSGRTVGVLNMKSDRVAAFDADDVSLAESLTEAISLALENAHLFQQTQAALGQLETTNRLLVRQGWQGHLERPSTVRRSELATAPAPRDVPDSNGADGNSTDGNGAESLAIPLELRGQRLGQLKLRREGNRPWTEDEKEMIQVVALQTILAADNARLVEQTQFALQETEGLFAAARDIAQAAQIQDICQSLTSYVNVLEQADRTIVTLVDTDRRQILARVGAGNTEGDLDMTFDEFDAGLGGQVLRSGEPVLSLSADDSKESEETRERRKRHPEGVDSNIGSLIIVPLSIKGQVMGTVSIVNRTHQRKFNQRNVDLATALAGPAATALENVRLLEATQRRAEREQRIRQITTRVRAAADIESVLETTASELAHTLGVPRAIVRLTMREGA